MVRSHSTGDAPLSLTTHLRDGSGVPRGTQAPSPRQGGSAVEGEKPGSPDKSRHCKAEEPGRRNLSSSRGRGGSPQTLPTSHTWTLRGQQRAEATDLLGKSGTSLQSRTRFPLQRTCLSLLLSNYEWHFLPGLTKSNFPTIYFSLLGYLCNLEY